jgi:hypothetical protein
MDLFATLGISREAGLTAALAGLAFAALLGLRLVLRREKRNEHGSLNLSGHD